MCKPHAAIGLLLQQRGHFDGPEPAECVGGDAVLSVLLAIHGAIVPRKDNDERLLHCGGAG